MLNYGKVYIAGAELNTFWQYRITSRYILRLNGNVTYQKAVDRTDPNSKTYNHQIPYTPLWSGSASLSMQTPWITVTYALIGCDKRYALSQNIPANVVAFGAPCHVYREINERDDEYYFRDHRFDAQPERQGFGLRFKVVYSY